MTNAPAGTRKAELYASLVPPAWYVVCAQREYRARDELQERGVGEVWLPECRVVVTKRRARTIVDGPLFPGYLFVRGILTDEWLKSVLSARHIDDLLRVNAYPIAAREQQMAKLQRLVADNGGRILIEHGRVKRGFDHIDEEAFKPDQELRILDGPFAGFNALYRKPAGRDRIKILVDIFGRVNEMTIDEASVETVV